MMSASHFHPFNNQRDLLKFYDKNTECVAISPERVGLYYTMNKALCHCNLIMMGLFHVRHQRLKETSCLLQVSMTRVKIHLSCIEPFSPLRVGLIS